MVSRRMVLAAVALLATGPALAHHGWSGYDSKLVKLAGLVRAISVENPHAEMRLEADGKLWLIILSPPSRMSARGLPASQIKVGDEAAVEGYASRSKSDEVRAERISHGGTTIELR